MNKQLCISLLVIPLIFMIGCTSVKRSEGQDPSVLRDLKPGDEITLIYKNGEVVTIRLGLLTANEIAGSEINGSNRYVRADLEEVKELQYESIDGGKTALAIVGGTVGVVILLPIFVLGAGLAAGT